MKFWLFLVACIMALAGCSGGGPASTSGGGTGNSGGTGAGSTLSVALSSSTVTSAQPATVTAKVLDDTGAPVANVVVDFAVDITLGALSASAALTDSSGVATVTLSPATASATGADTLTASTTVGTTQVSASIGYQLSATTATIDSFAPNTGESASDPLSAYGQAVLTLSMSGVSPAAPVNLSVSSACVAAGKATITPTTQSNSSGTATFTYKDVGGCGSMLSTDTVTVSIAGSSTNGSTTVYLTSPTANSITFTSATPQVIYLKGSGNTESSTVVFQVVDTAGNPLPGQAVTLNLSTFAGGLTLDQHTQTELQANPDVKTSDANGQVSVIVNSGTVPTPVRVLASLASGANTVSSNLAVVTGLPSQLNFSLSQTTINIEGMNFDGRPNAYNVFAADRSGNPVPDGTTILFWAEGGQIQGSAQTVVSNGVAAATANFVSAEPRPLDGRVTIVAYAIGEESFVDLHGTNVWESDDPYQDLGNVVKSKKFDGIYDPNNDEVVSLSDLGAGSGGKACTNFSGTYPQFALNMETPNQPNTCDATWSPKTYVRRATETIFSTTTATAYASYTQLDDTCVPVLIQESPDTLDGPKYVYPITGSTNNVLYVPSAAGSFSLDIGDSNIYRLNPMAAGSTVAGTHTDPAIQTFASAGGNLYAIPSMSSATPVSFGYQLTSGHTSGAVEVDVTSMPSKILTAVPFMLNVGVPAHRCQPPN